MPKAVTALLLSSHPGPSIAVTIVTVVLSIGAGLDPWRVALLAFAMLFDQLSVGFSNDWIDAARDRQSGRTDKPVAAGLISAPAVRTAAFVSAVLSLVLTAPLGLAALVAHTIVLFSAWSYNAWLKNTPISVLPFIVSFGSLPLLATLSSASPVFAAWWAFGAGAMLGIAAHFSNVLPDLDADAATGVHGLPHRMGRRVSGIVVAFALVAASAFIVVGSPDLVHWIGLGVSLVLAIVCAYLVLTRPPTRLLFQLIIVGALVDVVLLAVSGSGFAA